MKKIQTITLEQARKRMQFFEQVEAYNPITLVKRIVSYTMIGAGVITLPLPTGSIFLIMGGCAILAIDYKILLKTINFHGKETVYWILRKVRRKSR